MHARRAPAMSDTDEKIVPSSYYGRPVIKPPAWGWYIGAYFFFGGMAGASATLALAARATNNRPLARSATLAATFGAMVSPVLLIVDLHDPKRFLNMFRVIKPTSPMSVGSWILGAFGAAITAAAAGEFFGIARPVGRAGEVVAGLLGPALATYTATLIANTAIPVWHGGRTELPFIFAGGSMCSAASFALIATPVADAKIARRLLVLGSALEIFCLEEMDKSLGPLLAEPYELGAPATLKNIARTAIVASILLVPAARKHRGAAVAAGLFGLAGALCERFSIFEAAKRSAHDPKYTVEPQRARRDAREQAEAKA
jgi:formate-dependent nitrite reductase membrane component NrfD